MSLPFTQRRAMQIEVLGDRYQLQDPIGKGGMAAIYRGRDLHMDRVVAVKVLHEVYNTNPKFVTRFQREAKAASSLQHPNIVQVYDYGQTDGKYYIVMELVEGTDLRRYLHSRGVLDVDRSVIIAHDIALGLGAAHRRGIVHRDVKPQNILLGSDGAIKLTDFGIAWVKENNARRLTTTGMTLGTVQYYSPEQAQGEIVSPAADVYALGIVLYEMLIGRPPFDGDSLVAVAMQHIRDVPIPPSQLNPSIPAALEEIILRCLEKAPEMRFRDGSQLARAFAMLGDAESGETVPVTPGHAPIPTTSHHIPSRPSNSGRGGTVQNVPPRSPASSSDNGVPSDQNDAGHIPGPLVNQPTYRDQQSFAPPPGSAAPYLLQRGTVPRSGAVQPDRRDARFASMITILILLATLLLLGFSVYLAVQPGFIPFPIFSGGGTPTPPANGLIEVPDLHHMSWSDALAKAQKAEFRLVSVTGQTEGVVIDQNPKAHDKATKDSTIDVSMDIVITTVPPIPLDSRLATVEAILRNAYLQYTVKYVGQDLALPPNTVTNWFPATGATVDVGSTVTLYVNYISGSPAVTPARGSDSRYRLQKG